MSAPHSPAELLLEIGAILLVLGLIGGVARHYGFSPVSLYLLTGLALGDGGVWTLGAASEFLTLGAEIGLVLLLLTLGLEFSAEEFTNSLRRHLPSGLVDLVLNATPGAVAGVVLGYGWQGALALAGVTWVSSSGLVARVLNDLGRLANRETPSVLSVLVLEDLAMAVYLPLTAVLIAGGGLGLALIGVAASVGAVTLVLLGSRFFGERLGRRLTDTGDEQVLLRVLGLTLIVAGFTTLLDASAAVGAFLVGLALTGQAAERAREVLGPLRDLFAAVFFVAFGLSVDPGALPAVLPAAILLAVVTLFTKVATGWFAAARDGVGTLGRMRAGTVLAARGEFAVIIAGLAVVAGIDEIGPVTAAYVILLAVATPVLTRFSDQLARPLVRAPA